MHMWVISVGRHLSWTLKNILHAPAEDRTGDSSIYSLALYHVAIKVGFYSDVVECSTIDQRVPGSILDRDMEMFFKSP